MASNVFTKSEILQQLASRGYFIDAYTLDTFFKKWKIESIFEDEQGSEFYDKNVLDTVLNNLFSAKDDKEINTQEETIRELKPKANIVDKIQQKPQQIQQQINVSPAMPNIQQNIPQTPQQVAPQIAPMPQMHQIPPQYGYHQPYIAPQMPPQYGYHQPVPIQKPVITDPQTIDILNDISLSDGTPLINSVQNIPLGALDNIQIKKEDIGSVDISETKKKKNQKTGILEGAIQLAEQDDAKIEAELASLGIMHDDLFQQPEETPSGAAAIGAEGENQSPDSETDFDDISLLSESLEAQEKFKEYVISELQRKNADFNPNVVSQNNEFKLDISERTIAMVAKTMAKKIAKNLNNIFSADAKSSAELGAIKEEYKKLEARNNELEKENKKLRLLLSENKKYLNSFKPSIFGLYKKVNPNEVKEKKSPNNAKEKKSPDENKDKK